MVPTDRVAEKLLPNAALNYRPLSAPADGNCFFDAVSIALLGSTALAETLRLLTAIEIGRADNNYFLHPIIETAMSLPCVHQRETHIWPSKHPLMVIGLDLFTSSLLAK
ncbi:hypothetical protein PoB_005127500 [Plakobranchus ocellatus]|uniref:OTU domain-containing protein n=1 Tax=Plakobranchus ocellatus TaxID=259542 RepID=A0AAV4BZJ4_9GAST|nr:hypothetical protein PoB_005127500 [Plakobranchus ocellatus]